MSRWMNPNDPIEIGLEWQGATRMLAEPVDFAREVGHRFVLPQTITVDAVRWFSPGPVPSSSPDSLFYESWVLATIYEVGNEREFGSVDRGQVSIIGGSSTTGAIMGNTVLGPATTVQEALSALDQAFVRLDPGESIRARFDGLTSVLATQPRILNITFDVYASPVATGTNITFGFRSSAGVVFPLAIAPHPASAGGRVYSWSTGELFMAAYDFITNIADDRRRPWLRQDLLDLANGTVEFYIANTGSELVDINWASMSVDYASENRVATGGLERGARHANFTHQTVGWQEGIELVNPVSGATGVTLLQGREYALTLTRATDSYLPEQILFQNNTFMYQQGLARDVRALANADGFPMTAVEYPRDTRGLIIGDATAVDRGYALTLEAQGTDDTLPYASNPYSFVANVDNAVSEQTVMTTQSGSYAYVRLPLRKFGQPANLVVTVLGATATLSSDAFDDVEVDANGWTIVTLPLAPAISIPANTNVTVSIAKGLGADRWEVPALFTSAGFFDGNEYAVSTYGGADQTGTDAFLNFNPQVDYAVTLLMPAPAVTGVTVTQGIQELAQLDPTCPAPGRITALDYASICWDDVPIVSGSGLTIGYIDFPGTANNVVLTPDAPALDVTGDLTLIARVAPDDWTAAAAQAVVAKFNVFGGLDQRSYMLRVTPTGALELIWSTDGTLANQLTATSTANLGALAPNVAKWISASLDVDNGAAGRTIRFWTSDDGFAWTKLGTDVVQAGVTSIFSGPATLDIGHHSSGTGTSPFIGNISDVIVRSGVGPAGHPVGGTTVFEMRHTNIPPNSANTFPVTSGQTMQVGRSGSPATTLYPSQIVTVTGAPLQTSFCAWEVERREDDEDWQLIARISERNNRCVSDYEGAIGVSTDYRVRLCRLDGLCGDWATVTGFVREGISVTGAGAGCQGLIFTSNENPDATLAYPLAFDNSPEEEFNFYESETVVLERLHMRDYMVAFRPLERGGVRFQRDLLVNAISIPPKILDEGFRELRDLAWDTLSYVAVLDTRGRKWYVAVIVPSGTVRWTRQLYLASIEIVEVTNRSSVVDVGSA